MVVYINHCVEYSGDYWNFDQAYTEKVALLFHSCRATLITCRELKHKLALNVINPPKISLRRRERGDCAVHLGLLSWGTPFALHVFFCFIVSVKLKKICRKGLKISSYKTCQVLSLIVRVDLNNVLCRLVSGSNFPRNNQTAALPFWLLFLLLFLPPPILLI